MKGGYVKMLTKDDNLKESGAFNNNYANVKADIFNSSPFFDKRDVVQVKYEMLRAASNDEDSITAIADAYGFSRKSFYQVSKAFEATGLCSLVPQKKGPKRPSKLNSEAVAFITAFSKEHKNAKASDVSAALEAERGIKVHPRTIYRHFKKNWS
jgi:transposase